MILSKKFNCNTEDLDSITMELAKEIENGWHIERISVSNSVAVCCYKKSNEPDFFIELVRRRKV